MRATVANRQRRIKTDTRKLARDCREALRFLELDRAELSVALVSPTRMRALNREYRQIDSTTDVLSFAMYHNASEFPADDVFMLGDIVIDPVRATEQAAELGHSLDHELRRLMVHGLAHLMGYDHEAGGAQQREMRKVEKRLMSRLEKYQS